MLWAPVFFSDSTHRNMILFQAPLQHFFAVQKVIRWVRNGCLAGDVIGAGLWIGGCRLYARNLAAGTFLQACKGRNCVGQMRRIWAA